jgi:hypothetical protein
VVEPSSRRAIVRLVLAAAVTWLAPGAAWAQEIDENMWVTNGTVNTVVHDGGTVYLGGWFTQVGPATGGGVPLDATTGLLPPWFPRVAGSVDVAVPDGTGGWYIGGWFTSVGGFPRHNLAHLASDLSVSAWNPDVSNGVDAIAMSGSTIYVGGNFTSIGGQLRSHIAALDAVTGALTSWNPGANADASALAIVGNTVYAMGAFTTIGGQARNHLAAIDATTGVVTPWNPDANGSGTALAVSGSVAYVGGFFTNVGGQTRNYLAALDLTTGAPTAWNPSPNNYVYAIAVNGSTVYAGGRFTAIGGQTRRYVGALDATTGSATAWNPNANRFVLAIVVSGDNVYAGGEFTGIGGQARSRIAALDRSTGLATIWNPNVNEQVGALAVSGNTVYAGGSFTGVAGQTRNYIAALDAATGVATSWNPDANNGVYAIVVNGSTVHAAGSFGSIGGQTRNRIAALDATTGLATAWNPNANGEVYALAMRGSTIYAGGTFSSMGGQPRSRLAAISAVTGLATGCDPAANAEVFTLAINGSTVLAGGSFTQIGGLARNRIAALDSSLCTATDWNPNADNLVRTLGVGGSTIYAGGDFTSIGGQLRNRIAALYSGSGNATAWNPNINQLVRTLVVGHTAIYAGGDFWTIGGQSRPGLGAIDRVTGAATSWNPVAGDPIGARIFAISLSESNVYAGGAYWYLGNSLQSYIAGISRATTDVPPFTDISAGLPDVTSGATAWGDYDNDGDLDVALMGDTGGGYISRIYRNDGGGAFTNINAGLPGLFGGSLAWGDYDNDGDLDLAVTGDTGSGYVSRINRNDGSGVFTPISAWLRPVGAGKLAWGDFDNDGDLDLVLTGNAGTWASPVPYADVYRNDGGGAFELLWFGLTPVFGGSVAWGDCDRDGDLDLLLTGNTGSALSSRVYRNDGGDFVAMAQLPGVWASSGEWGDFDNDGDLDILLTGYNNTPEQLISRIYRNEGGGEVFTDIGAGLPGLCWSAAVWGDYDNDGDLDILLTGSNGSGGISRVYHNDGGGLFVDLDAGLPGVIHSTAAWGDYDNDGKLDILLTGEAGSNRLTRIYRSSTPVANTPPAAPAGLSAQFNNNWGTFSWVAPADAQTPASGLSYNLRVGTSPGGSEICAAMASHPSGYRRVVQLGNAQQRTSWRLKVPSGGHPIYWSVQAVDGAFAGSPFAPEQTVTSAFTDIGAGLPGVSEGSVAWGDYDNDGDLDVVVAGETGLGSVSRIYRNDAGVFTDTGAGLAGMRFASAAWGDYDNDGDLDLVITGEQSSPGTRLYRNDMGSFVEVATGLPGAADSGSLAWGDYDNDGDLDLALIGLNVSVRPSRIYRNDGPGTFHDIGAVFEDVSWGNLAWGDYDNDGDLDLALTGFGGSGYVSIIYRNTAGQFAVDGGANLVGVGMGTVAWGDYNSDGRLDLLLTGYNDGGFVSRVYRNTGTGFADINAGLPGVVFGAAAWGDYDNDGSLDILLTGDGEFEPIARVYRNVGGSFTDIGMGLPAVRNGAVAWGDYDRDGKLDILASGQVGDSYLTQIFRNNAPNSNTSPSAPGGLSAAVTADQVTLHWNPSTDGQTPASGLSYNLRVGSTPGGSEICSPMASVANGYRRVVQLGNAQQRTSWTLSRPPGANNLYWSVQAVDGAFAGSPFAPEQTACARGACCDPSTGSCGMTCESDCPTPSVWHSEWTACMPNPCPLPPFSDIGAGLPGMWDGSAVWGDYDSDGDLDVLLTGQSDSAYFARVYRNNGDGTFSDLNAGLPGVTGRAAAAWGDYDRDGDLDILLAGVTASDGLITRVYRNDGGVFADINAGLPGTYYGSASWADFDNDGDLDIMLTGAGWSAGDIARIYRNDGGVFTDTGAGLPGVKFSSAAWGDYDKDGDLDLLLTGDTGSGYISRVYRNDHGSFTDLEAGLPGVRQAAVAWGDYDSDGDLDLLLAGDDAGTPIARVYHQSAGVFTDLGAGLPGVWDARAAWGDYDNDGDLDLVLTGWTGSEGIFRVFRNDGGSFTDIAAGFPGVAIGSAAWGDFDNNGKLDLLMTGNTGTGFLARIYRNNTPTANTPPTAPGSISALLLGNQVTFNWNPSTDAQTPTPGLSYNLRVGTTPGGSDVCSPMASAANGYRRVVQLGNAQQRTSWALNLPSGASTLYWSVQALDGAFAGSPFAAEQSVVPLFSEVGSGLPDIYWGGAAWGDYDRDGDLDVLLAGWTGQERITRVYRSDGGTFIDTGAGLPGVCWSGMDHAWGDYDGDGVLDILLTGMSESGRISRVYRNDGGTFADIGAGLPGVDSGTGIWGDYDNDGDLDILLTGNTGTEYLCRVFRNDGGIFTNIGAGLPGISGGSDAAWGDYDNDGDLDILLSGDTGSGYVTRIYRNTGGAFADIGAGLASAYLGSVAWGDYDSDGDLDILMTGFDGATNLTKVYRNHGGVFTDIGAALPAVSSGSAASWGDYDNDGDLDILLTGHWQTGPVSRVYRNDGGNFSDSGLGLPAVWSSCAVWGDYNNDGRLDILLTGQTGSGCLTRIYRNNTLTANTPPTPPGDLAAYDVGNYLLFNWTAATDGQTPSAGLTYNLRIGSTPGGSQLMPAMANSATGYRRVVQIGNTNHRRAWMIRKPTVSCYWSVQALDGAFAGSAFAPEQSIEVSGVGGEAQDRETALLQVVPNPTGSSVSIHLALAEDLPARLEVFDPAGRRVWSWQDPAAGKGVHVVVWDGRNDAGRRVSSGTYYLRFVTPRRSWTQSILLLR